MAGIRLLFGMSESTTSNTREEDMDGHKVGVEDGLVQIYALNKRLWFP